MRKTISIVLVITMLLSLLIAGVTLGVWVLEEPYDESADDISDEQFYEPIYEPIYKPYHYLFEELTDESAYDIGAFVTSETFAEIDIEQTNGGWQTVSTMINGAVLNLSEPDKSVGDIWFGENHIHYNGTEPLTIMGSNADNPRMILVSTATEIFIQDNTTIVGNAKDFNVPNNIIATLSVPGGSTITGGGSNITIREFTHESLAEGIGIANHWYGDIEIAGTLGSVSGISVAMVSTTTYNLTISGNIGTIRGGIWASENLTISGRIDSIVPDANVYSYAGLRAGGNINITGTVGSVTSNEVGISARGININNPITVIGNRSAFSTQPVIGITPEFSATWSNDISGLPIGGSSNNEYIRSWEHRWVRISDELITDPDNGNGTEPEPGNGNGSEEDIYADEEEHMANNNITVNVVVDPNTHGDFHTQQHLIKIRGAAFNAPPNSTANVHFSDPDSWVEIDGERFHTNRMVQVNIQLMVDGVPLAPGTPLAVPIEITVPIPTGLGNDPSLFRILHFQSDGTYEIIVPTINDDGTCTFVVTHFSVFVFVDMLDTTEETATDDNNYETAVLAAHNIPQTGDTANTVLWVSLLSVSALGIAVVMVWQRKRVHNK